MKRIILYGIIAAALVTRSTPAEEPSFPADSAVISGPFVATNGYIYQAVQTSATNGGRARYSFSVTNAGSYAIRAEVNVPKTGVGSFYVNVDAEPQEPHMVWDISATSGFEQHFISWRGNGTPATPEFNPQFFDLTAGTHQLIIRGKEANTQLKTLTILMRPSPPSNLHPVAGQ